MRSSSGSRWQTSVCTHFVAAWCATYFTRARSVAAADELEKSERGKKKSPLLLVQRQHFECDCRIHRRLLMESFTFQWWSALLYKPPRVITARAADFRATPTIFLAYSNECAFVRVQNNFNQITRNTSGIRQ